MSNQVTYFKMEITYKDGRKMEEMALGVGVAGAMTLLRCIGDWIIFIKAGKPGWHSIIPILHMYDEYDICWKGSNGVLAALLLGACCYTYEPASDSGSILAVSAICAVLYMILEFKESRRLAWAFGKGSFFGLFLFFFGGLGRIILGLGGSRYRGRRY